MTGTDSATNLANILIERIAAGDPHAEAELFERLDLLTKVQVIVHSSSGVARLDRDDLVSEILRTVLELLRSGKFDPTKGALSSYLRGVARNVIREYWRKSGRMKTQDEYDLEQIEAERPADLSEVGAELMQNIEQLEQKYRSVILLRYYQNMSIEDVAATLDLTTTQVYNRIHYGLRLLREKFVIKV